MTRGLFVLLAIAGLASATAAAWSTGVLDHRVPLPIAKEKKQIPSWAGSDRTFITEAQNFEARAEGLFDRDVKSVLNVTRPMKYGEYRWDEKNVPKGPIWVRVDLKRQLISVFRGGHEIGTAVILYGADEKETPVGTFPVLAKIRDHKSITYDNAPMPYTLRLTGDGVSIHGSDVSWGRATHGCIGVPVEFAHKLFDQASKGDQVTIVSERRSA
jgi:lipoprotein-anchoring transpeptidase ErfK/SrfK